MAATFAELLALHMPRVQRAALGWLRDEEEAREVAQEALARAWAARDRYDPRRPFYPWLYTIVKNLCRDARARKRARPGLEAERLVSPLASPLAEVSAAEARARVRAAMERLDPAHAEILNLRHFQDLTYAEIAEILGIPQGTVMSRLFRARRALLDRLRDPEPPGRGEKEAR